MADVVNLNKFRKRKAKSEREQRAETNRRLHGRTKLERERDALQKKQLQAKLDGKKLEKPGADSQDDGPSPGMTEATLLAQDEPSPVEVFLESGQSEFVLVCDHAGNELPRSLGSLGLSSAELATHIAWDIGAAGVARKLSLELDAPLFLQRYSRLVIDCNRPLSAPDSIAQKSGGITIPGNQGLSRSAAEERASAVFFPYHQRIRAALAAREALGKPYVLIAMHSFTPELFGVARPFHTGLLYCHDTRLARPLLELLRTETGLVVGDNEPYRASEGTDYSIIEYGERRAAPYVEIEIRQDLIADSAGQAAWAERFARLLRSASAAFQR